MFDEILTPTHNVISLAQVRAARVRDIAPPMRLRICRHCCAVLGENDVEEECSGAGFGAFAVPAWRVAE